MCGIAGIYGYHYAALAVERAELRRIRDHMVARGPDGAGEWYSADGRLALGHRRLSIIDLSQRAVQPMQNADGNLVVTFNGEIYNYRSLRRQLETKGYRFRTESDTEVLLHLYADKGDALVHDLRGMFAFALWDGKRQALLLARDPYGIKPLYYADDGWTFRFASQVKALLAGGRISRDPEPAGLAGFCLFGYVPEPYTTYLEIRSVPAGSCVWVDATGSHASKPYFSLAQIYREAEHDGSVNSGDYQKFVTEALLDSVRHHLVADVPVGVFLSSGIDSSALLGLMRDTGQADIQAITVAFDEYRGEAGDEAPLARLVAERYGARHTTRVVTEREFHDDLPKILEAMDQPSIDGINTWFAAKAAHEQGLKVVISGLGGDELFGGYPSFLDLPRWVRTLSLPGSLPFAGDVFRRLMNAIGPAHVHRKSAGLLKYGGTYAGAYLLRRGLFMPWEIDAFMDTELIREGLRRLSPVAFIADAINPAPATPFAKVATLEAAHYMRNQLLRDADWAGMAHSLEIRLPLVDARLLERIARVTTRRATPSKKWLAASPTIPLPAAVTAREKTGFTTPIERWLLQGEHTQAWRHVSSLANPACPWARRWAYEILRHNQAVQSAPERVEPVSVLG